MDFVSPLYQVLQDQAKLDLTRATTADTQALAGQRLVNQQLLGMDLQERVATNKAMQTAYQGMGVDPRLDMLAPKPEDTPVQAAEKDARRLQVYAEQHMGAYAKVAEAGGSPKALNQIRDDANNAMFRAGQAERVAKELRNQQQATYASVAGATTDENTFRINYPRLAELDPQLTQKLAFDKDQSGQPVWGPITRSTMSAVNRAGMTANQQGALDAKSDKIALDEQRLRDQQDKTRLQGEVANAKIAALQSQGELAEARAESVRTGKALKQANMPLSATGPERKAARAAVDAEFADAKFDGSIDRFANDVADRAKKIVADSKAAGNPVGMDDAREQALEELKHFVADKEVKKDKTVLGITYGTDVSKVKTYTRNGPTKEVAAGEALPMPTSKTDLKSGQVYNTARGPAKWDGTQFVAQ